MTAFSKQPSQLLAAITSLGLVVLIGYLDYATGYETSFFLFYLIGVVFALRFIGVYFAVFISILSGVVWNFSNTAAGMTYSHWLIPVWNTTQRITFYIGVVGLLMLREELEERVRQRTAALTREMQERRRLEKELLEASEREQRRIGHDLHDSLCQHLTATALAGQVLGQKLADKSLPEALAANKLVGLVEEAIELTRTLARSLHPVEMQAEGLMHGFQELAANTRERFNVSCTFECPAKVLLQEAATNTHLYRIAQEAITNAIRHGKAKHIVIRLETTSDQAITLTVTDDGSGLTEKAQNNDGMGLRIMAYRASMIGATFNIKRLPLHGTCVTCILPVAGAVAI